MASLVSYRAERCANTEALERHEDEIDEVEAERERFEKEVEDEFRNYVKEVL